MEKCYATGESGFKVSFLLYAQVFLDIFTPVRRCRIPSPRESISYMFDFAISGFFCRPNLSFAHQAVFFCRISCFPPFSGFGPQTTHWMNVFDYNDFKKSVSQNRKTSCDISWIKQCAWSRRQNFCFFHSNGVVIFFFCRLGMWCHCVFNQELSQMFTKHFIVFI